MASLLVKAGDVVKGPWSMDKRGTEGAMGPRMGGGGGSIAAPPNPRARLRDERSRMDGGQQMMGFLNEFIVKKGTLPDPKWLNTAEGKYWLSAQRQRWLNGDDIDIGD
jgi:hypothetical protein